MSEKDDRIASLEGQLAETSQFLDRRKKLCELAYEAQQELIQVHQPRYVRVSSMPDETGTEGLFVLRCVACRTPEHHGYGPLNSPLWPCPSIAPLFDPSAFDHFSNRQEDYDHL